MPLADPAIVDLKRKTPQTSGHGSRTASPTNFALRGNEGIRGASVVMAMKSNRPQPIQQPSRAGALRLDDGRIDHFQKLEGPLSL